MTRIAAAAPADNDCAAGSVVHCAFQPLPAAGMPSGRRWAMGIGSDVDATDLARSAGNLTDRLGAAGSLPPGLVWAYRFSADGVAEALTPEHDLSAPAVGTWVWLHFNLSDQRARRWLDQSAPLSRAVRERLLSNDEHQRIEFTDQAMLGVFADLQYKTQRDSHALAHLRFAATERLLITARTHALHSVEATRQRIQAGERFMSGIALLESMVEQFAHRVGEVTSELVDALDQAEEQILGDIPGDAATALGVVRRQAVRIYRRLTPMKLLLERLREHDDERLRSSHLASRVAQRMGGVANELEAVIERARALQDEIAVKTAAETNRHLYTLSVITSLLLPPTLVTGIFGMNTAGLPLTKDGDGFAWAVVLMIVSSAIAYGIIRRAGIKTPTIRKPSD